MFEFSCAPLLIRTTYSSILYLAMKMIFRTVAEINEVSDIEDA